MLIIPFSKHTDFEVWQSLNCEKCKKYESKSGKESEAVCILAFNLDLASVSDSTITIEIAQRIGFNGIGLNKKCKEFETKRSKKVKSKVKQFNLF